MTPAERDRIAAHQTAMADLANFANIPDAATAADLTMRLGILETLWDEGEGRDWEEFAEAATEAYRQTRNTLLTLLDDKLAAEAATDTSDTVPF
jgi:hypothetical protein